MSPTAGLTSRTVSPGSCPAAGSRSCLQRHTDGLAAEDPLPQTLGPERVRKGDRGALHCPLFESVASPHPGTNLSPCYHWAGCPLGQALTASQAGPQEDRAETGLGHEASAALLLPVSHGPSNHCPQKQKWQPWLSLASPPVLLIHRDS